MSVLEAGLVALAVGACWSLLEPVAAARSPAARVFRWTAALGLGLGLSSCLQFAGLLVVGPRLGPLLEATCLVLALAWLRLRRRNPSDGGPMTAIGGAAPTPSRTAIAALFAVALACTLASFALHALDHPNGTWDAWGIWNMRAKSLYLGGEDWRAVFTDSRILSHLDYPLLLPGVVAKLWRVVGTDAAWVPAAVAGSYAAATVALIVSFFALQGSPTLGLVAGLCLLGVPELVTRGSQQTADIPLAFYTACATALLFLALRGDGGRGLLPLCGLCVGFASWTKNEGLLVAAALLVASPAAWPGVGPRRFLADAMRVAAGAAPVLLFTALFKSRVAPANDILSSARVAEIRSMLADGARHARVFESLGAEIVAWGGGLLVALALAACLSRRFLGAHLTGGERRATRWVSLTLLCVLAGFYLTFVITPKDLAWHLDTSRDRLVWQLWPSTVLLLARCSPDPWKPEPT